MKVRCIGIKLVVLFFIVFMTGCSSVKQLSSRGDADIVILIIDENEQPVKDFRITLSLKDAFSSAVTNEQGMCAFYGIPYGQIAVTGIKDQYTRLNGTLESKQNGNVFCFKILSADQLFLQVLDLYANNQEEQALQLLDKLYSLEGTPCFAVHHLFTAWGLCLSGQNERAQSELTLVEEDSNPDVSSLIALIKSKIKEETAQ